MKKTVFTLLNLLACSFLFAQELTQTSTAGLNNAGKLSCLSGNQHFMFDFKPPNALTVASASANSTGLCLAKTAMLNGTLYRHAKNYHHAVFSDTNLKIGYLPASQTFQKQKLQADISSVAVNGSTKNRRMIYSSLWTFTSLNYLYADLVGLMDANMLSQYASGTVNGIEMTPGFLTGAAAFMQIPLANVFLPHVIHNDKTLRWVQIASGTIMTLVQSATLFVDKPTPYYALFSAIEIGATVYITFDAIKWKSE